METVEGKLNPLIKHPCSTWWDTDKCSQTPWRRSKWSQAEHRNEMANVCLRPCTVKKMVRLRLALCNMVQVSTAIYGALKILKLSDLKRLAIEADGRVHHIPARHVTWYDLWYDLWNHVAMTFWTLCKLWRQEALWMEKENPKSGSLCGVKPSKRGKQTSRRWLRSSRCGFSHPEFRFMIFMSALAQVAADPESPDVADDHLDGSSNKVLCISRRHDVDVCRDVFPRVPEPGATLETEPAADELRWNHEGATGRDGRDMESLGIVSMR